MTNQELYDKWITDINQYKTLVGTDSKTWTKAEEKLYETVQRGFASYLPSPSKLNAHAVLTSNDTEKLAAWIFANLRPREENPYKGSANGT